MNKSEKDPTNMTSAAETAKKMYHQFMKDALLNAKLYLTTDQLRQKHIECRNQILKVFQRNIKEIGANDYFMQLCKMEVEQYINTVYDHFIIRNKLQANTVNRSAAAAAQAKYYKIMMGFVFDSSYLNTVQYKKKTSKTVALQEFRYYTKTSEDEYSKQYENELKKFIEYTYEECIRISNRFTREIEFYFLWALAETKQKYNKLMEEVCKNTELCLSNDELEQLHVKCKKKSSEELEKEFKRSTDFSMYKTRMQEQIDLEYFAFKISNADKAYANIAIAIASAKTVYHQHMTKIVDLAEPYLSLEELQREHNKCKMEALSKFDMLIKTGISGEFSAPLRTELKKYYINADCNHFIVRNRLKANAINRRALGLARVTYHQLVAEYANGKSPNLDALQSEHTRCKKIALKQFKKNTKPGEDEFSKQYRLKLTNLIEYNHECIKNANQIEREINFLFALAQAKQEYNNVMEEVCVNTEWCLSSGELEQKHIKCKKTSMEVFEKYFQFKSPEYATRMQNQFDLEYMAFKMSNADKANSNVGMAVTSAKGIYHLLMANVYQFDKSCPNLELLQREHNRSKTEALKKFDMIVKTAGISREFSIPHRTKLNEDIETKNNQSRNIHKDSPQNSVLLDAAASTARVCKPNVCKRRTQQENKPIGIQHNTYQKKAEVSKKIPDCKSRPAQQQSSNKLMTQVSKNTSKQTQNLQWPSLEKPSAINTPQSLPDQQSLPKTSNKSFASVLKSPSSSITTSQPQRHPHPTVNRAVSLHHYQRSPSTSYLSASSPSTTHYSEYLWSSSDDDDDDDFEEFIDSLTLDEFDDFMKFVEMLMGEYNKKMITEGKNKYKNKSCNNDYDFMQYVGLHTNHLLPQKRKKKKPKKKDRYKNIMYNELNSK